MEFVYALTAFGTLIVMMGLVSLTCTVPSWLIGRLNARTRRLPPSNILVQTRPRRWALWFLASTTALVGIWCLSQEFYPVGVGLLLMGSLTAQYAAYAIGYAEGDRRIAHREQHLYAPLPTNPGGQQGSRTEGRQPPPVGPPVNPPVNPPLAGSTPDQWGPPTSRRRDDGEADEFPMATPHDD